MLGSVFGFRGHVTGLQYFMGLLAVTVATFVGLAAFYQFTEDQSGDPASLIMTSVGLLVPVVAGLILWIQAALTVRRMRDIGLSPGLTIGLWLVFTVIDSLIALAVPAFSVAPFHLQTPVGEMIAMAMILFLIFWPSRHVERYVAPSEAIYRD